MPWASLGRVDAVFLALADVFRLVWATGMPLVLGLAACGSGREPETMEFRGSFSGTTAVVSPGQERSLQRCDANAGDGENPGFSTSGFDELTGEFNALGTVTIAASDCVHPERGEFAQGRATLTNADGDGITTKFHGSVQASDDPDVGLGRGEHRSSAGQADSSEPKGRSCATSVFGSVHLS